MTSQLSGILKTAMVRPAQALDAAQLRAMCWPDRALDSISDCALQTLMRTGRGRAQSP
jgi:hypothetical protein